MPVLNPTLKLTTTFQRFIASKTFNCVVLALIFFNAFLMFVKIVLDWVYPRTMQDYPVTLTTLDVVFWAITLTFLSLFVVEILARCASVGPVYFNKWIHALDFIISLAPIIIMACYYPSNLVNATHLGQFSIMLRIWRLVPVVILFHDRKTIEDGITEERMPASSQGRNVLYNSDTNKYANGMSQRRQPR